MEALIENGQVINIIAGHLDNSLPLEDIQPIILNTQKIDGYIYDIQVTKVVKVYNVVDLTAEEIRLKNVPQETLAYQAKEALILSGIMPTQIETIINGLASPTKELAMNQWLNAPTFKRYNSWISQLAPLIPLTELQLDDLFVLAETL